MERYTVAEVSAAFNAAQWKGLFEGGAGKKGAILLRNEAVLLEVVDVTNIDYEDNYGQSVFLVIEIDVNGQFFKKEGYYESHSGTEWGSYRLKEVEPKTKTVTVYE